MSEKQIKKSTTGDVIQKEYKAKILKAAEILKSVENVDVIMEVLFPVFDMEYVQGDPNSPILISQDYLGNSDSKGTVTTPEEIGKEYLIRKAARARILNSLGTIVAVLTEGMGEEKKKKAAQKYV